MGTALYTNIFEKGNKMRKQYTKRYTNMLNKKNPLNMEWTFCLTYKAIKHRGNLISSKQFEVNTASVYMLTECHKLLNNGKFS